MEVGDQSSSHKALNNNNNKDNDNDDQIEVMCPANESGGIDNEPLIQNNDVEEKDECDNISCTKTILHRLPLTEIREDIKSLGEIVWPVTTMTLLLHSKSVISMLYLGHLGDAALAGGALALSFANITGISVIKGMNMGMDPICCQAFGAKKLTVITQTFQKTLVILFLTAILISLLWLNMEPILLFLGQDQAIIEVAKLYLTYSIPELIAQVFLHPLRSFLRTQNITKPLTIATIICLLFHLPINFLLVGYFQLGVKGVALASAFNTLALDFSLILYHVFSADDTVLKPWHGLTVSSPFQGWRTVLGLAIPSLLSVCLEWWWYEIMLFLCGLLTNPKASVAAMGVLIQTTGLLYVFPHALSMGLSTRIGHELGAAQPNKAQRLALLGLVSAFTLGATAFAFTLGVESVWGKMFTSDNEILSLVSTALPVLGFCEIGNCPQTAVCGVLTGSARTKLGAKINFIAFYLVGLPVAVALAFWAKMGFIGLWIGLAAAQAACLGMMIYILVRTDWKYQAQRSEELTHQADDNDNDNDNDDDNQDLETALLLS